MKKVIIFSVIFILIAIAYMAGRHIGFDAGRDDGFKDGWAAAERESTVDWGEWR